MKEKKSIETKNARIKDHDGSKRRIPFILSLENVTYWPRIAAACFDNPERMFLAALYMLRSTPAWPFHGRPSFDHC